MPKDQTMALSCGPVSVEPLWYKFALGTQEPVFYISILIVFLSLFLMARVISPDVEADVSCQLDTSVIKDLI